MFQYRESVDHSKRFFVITKDRVYIANIDGQFTSNYKPSIHNEERRDLDNLQHYKPIEFKDIPDYAWKMLGATIYFKCKKYENL
jgi:hypothetical protein